MAKVKAKSAKAPKKEKPRKAAVEHEDAHEHRAADKVMQTVLAEHAAEADVVRLDEWVPIECPHCGEGTEIHVIAEMDGQSLDQDCTVCCRPFTAHIEIDDGEANVGVEAA